MKLLRIFAAGILIAIGTKAFADTFTMYSPAGGTLPSNVSAVGGLVTDLVGINGVRVVAQASASSEFIGYVPGYTGVSSPNVGYLLFAQQSGLSPSVIAALGGGLSSASFRVTLYDGDTKTPDFDFNQDFLYVGTASGAVGTKSTSSTGVNLGNFSGVTTEQTTGLGAAIGTNGLGFGNNILDTGFFSSTDSNLLSLLYGQLLSASSGSQMLSFQLRDNTYGDQYYDFTQGIDASLVNVGSGPVVSPPAVTPEPSSFVLLGTGVISAMYVGRKKFLQA